jgi:hypothetical protein
MSNDDSAGPRRVTQVLLAGASAQLGWIVARLEPAHERASLGRNEWSPRQVLAHLVMYEQHYLLPTLQLMARGEDALGLDITGTESDLRTPDEELVGLTAQQILNHLHVLEGQRSDLIESMSDEAFLTQHRSVWGWQTPRWVLEKSFGHYLEHATTIFYIGHFYALLHPD